MEPGSFPGKRTTRMARILMIEDKEEGTEASRIVHLCLMSTLGPGDADLAADLAADLDAADLGAADAADAADAAGTAADKLAAAAAAAAEEQKELVEAEPVEAVGKRKRESVDLSAAELRDLPNIKLMKYAINRFSEDELNLVVGQHNEDLTLVLIFP
jgi:hypothetical protein